MAELGQLIRQSRERQGLEAQELARRVGVSKGMMSSIERGVIKNVPDAAILRGISQQLGLPMARLLETLGYLEDIDVEVRDSDTVAALRPVIDRYEWHDGDIERIISSIEILGEMRRGSFAPRTSVPKDEE